MLANILTLIKDAVMLLGGALVVWGGVQLGLSLKERDGGQMASAFGWIVGGAVVIAAAAYFGQLSLGSLSGL